MLIVCSKCATAYQVDPSALGAAGRLVRCAHCSSVRFARDPAALTAIAQAYRTEVEALCASFAVPVTEDSPAELTGEAEQTPVEIRPEATVGQLLPATETSTQLPHEAIATIANAPAPAPMEPSTALPTGSVFGEELETFTADRTRPCTGLLRTPRRTSRRPHWSLPVLPTAIAALVVLNAALIAFRTDVVRMVPQTASLYVAMGLPVNLRGLSFTEVTTTAETHDGVQVLVVEGTIASASPHVAEVPRLRFSVRNEAGQEIYAWTALPGRSVLSPGEILAFRSRLASPPADARDVLVRFLNHRDLVAGIRIPVASGT